MGGVRRLAAVAVVGGGLLAGALAPAASASPGGGVTAPRDRGASTAPDPPRCTRPPASAPRSVRDRAVDRCTRLNQVQVLGTHNSYHRQGRPTLLAAIAGFDPALAAGWEYDHRPLPRQLDDLGIRQVELDVFADPEGGLYRDRAGLRVIGEDSIGSPVLDRPGFKVLHVQDLDFESTCLTLRACLRRINRWSRANPRHLPVVVQIEPKDAVLPDLGLGFVEPVPFDAAQFDALDAEIRSVLKPRRLITPDDVRGGRRSLERAVRRDGWPTLRESRGKLLFALDTGGAKRDAYVAGHPALRGRVLFTNSEPGTPEAAYLVRNDSIAEGDDIRRRVAEGYLVRTRADADTVQARSGDTTMRRAALRSGAQLVSSDYPEPDPDFGTGYLVRIPGPGIARCNPVNTAPACRTRLLERLDLGS